MAGAVTVGLDYGACAARLSLCGLWDDQVARGLRMFERVLIEVEAEQREEHAREARDQAAIAEWHRRGRTRA